jgi:hypothetical protein
MEYRLSIRNGKNVVLQEVHRSPRAASERAEDLRRQAIGVKEPAETDPKPSTPSGQKP